MGGGSKGQAFGDGLLDPEDLEDQLRDHISQYTGDNDNGNRNRRDAVKLLGNAHSYCSRDGLRKKGHILLMVEAKGQSQHEDASHAGNDAGDDPQNHSQQILF